MITGHLMHAINLYDSINIKSIRPAISGKVLETNPQEMHAQYGDNSFLFVYRFGCIVFYNMAKDLIEAELSKIKSILGPGLKDPTSETYQVNIGDTQTHVEFEYVEMKKATIDQLKFIAVTVGQSAALEYFELQSERMLSETSNLLQNMARWGMVPLQNKSLIKIIGSTAAVRQHIVSNLSILDPPEETWKSKELERFFRELQNNFDIDVRFRTLDRKLTLVQDNIEILTDLTASRRSNFLEALIVALIVIEIGLAFVHK